MRAGPARAPTPHFRLNRNRPRSDSSDSNRSGRRLVDLEEERASAVAIASSLSRPGVRVLELRTERERNVELHRAITRAATAAAEATLS